MRVYGYVRVSTDRQDLQRQKQQISDYCESNNHELLYIYSEKISGATEAVSREKLSQLLEKTGEDADLIVVSEMSRYSREENLVAVVYSISQLLQRGLSILFLDNKSKIYQANTTLSIEDTIMLIAKAYANSEERKKIFERMYSRKLQLIKQYPNVLIGNNIPYGYKPEPNPRYNPKKPNGEPKTFLVEDEYEKEIVIELFKRSASGETYYELQKYFNEKNRRPMMKSGKHHTGNGDTERITITIPSILNNTLYYGDRVHAKEIYHLNNPFITKELFLQSQEAHKRNRLVCNNGAKCFNPLKGIIKCTCGASMALATIRGKKVYTCYKSKKASKVIAEKWCGNWGISQELLVDIINYDLKHGLNDEVRQKYDKATSNKLQEIHINLRELQTKFTELNRVQREKIVERDNLDRAIRKISDDIIQNRYLTMLLEIEKEIKSNTITLNELSDEINSLKDYERTTINQNNKFVVNDCNDNEFPNYLRTIIQKVIYRGYDSINGFVTIYYLNGFKTFYAVRKPRTGRNHEHYDAEIYPIAEEYVNIDRNGKILYRQFNNEFKEIQNIDDIKELVRIGQPVAIFGNKIRAFHQRFI